MSEPSPTCQEAEGNLVGILSELLSRDIIRTPHQDRLTRAFTKCLSCRKSRRKCLGWDLSLKDDTAIEFRDFEIRRRRVFARLEGVFSTVRSRPSRRLDDWNSQPCGASSCAIVVLELANGGVIARHHHDLANQGQHGPVWHLQMGGGSTSNHQFDIPRWPAVPMDPVLVIELAVYSFFRETWESLRSSNPWRHIIRRSEGLLLPHYYTRLREYCDGSPDAHSWLEYQCNVTGSWDPRPT